MMKKVKLGWSDPASKLPRQPRRVPKLDAHHSKGRESSEKNHFKSVNSGLCHPASDAAPDLDMVIVILSEPRP